MGLIFFFASAAASSAYLTVSEIFPLELRGMAIALFYSVGTAIGGPLASYAFGNLLDRSKPLLDANGVLLREETRAYLFSGDIAAATVLLIAAGVTLAFGINAERQSLEIISQPLSCRPEIQHVTHA